MRKLAAVLLGLLLAIAIHVDWHLARAHHHRLSLGWRQHWIFAALLFAVAGWMVARTWPASRWTAGAWVLALGILVGQGLEPVLEAVGYEHRLGYPVEPERWMVLAVCLAAGIPAYALALWLCAPRTRAARLA
jgi:hypothetical protein